MTHLPIDGEQYACPFFDLVRPHTSAEFEQLEGDILRRGQIDYPVLWYLSPRWNKTIVDGMTRARIGLAHGLDVPMAFMHLTDAQGEERAKSLNVARRHLSPEEQQALRTERLPRIRSASKQGQTVRQIAAAEGISPAQAQRDLTTAKSSARTDAGSAARGPHRRPIDRAKLAARQLSPAVSHLLGRPSTGPRLRGLCQSYGVPLADDGTWPALDAVAAVLRDL